LREEEYYRVKTGMGYAGNYMVPEKLIEMTDYVLYFLKSRNVKDYCSSALLVFWECQQ